MSKLLNVGRRPNAMQRRAFALAIGACVSFAGCGGGGGPAIEARPQSIAFTDTPPAVNAPGTVVVTATATSGLAVVYASATPDNCLVDSSSGLVTGVAAGQCAIIANQAGNTTYAPAPRVTQDLMVIAGQTISFGAPPELSLLGSALVVATASSGLAVTYSSLTPGVCTVDAGTGLVTDLTAGNCTIAADQAGNANYRPAPQQVQTLGVAAPVMARQTISFGAPPALSLHGSATVVATASSGLAVTYSSLTPGVCTVNAGSGLVTDLTAGNCTIAADQPGNANYEPAPQQLQTLTVAAPVAARQTISFGPPPTLSLLGSATVVATASSGLAVTYSSLTPGVCTVNAGSGLVTDLTAGNCTIAADQPGNANYDPAPRQVQTLSVAAAVAARQTISFGPPPTLSLLGSATVVATASSGLAVTYSSLTPGVCTVDAGTGLVTDLTAGNCTIAADQAGNANYRPAPQQVQTLGVAAPVMARQTISFGAPPALSLHGSATVVATASSGLAVTYSSLTPGVCTVNAGSGLVTDLTAGNCTIAADQPGNANYDPAPRQVQTLTVAAAPPASLPGVPPAVAATLGANASTAIVTFGATGDGGSPITGYRVVSSPAGISASGTSSPVTVACPVTCAGYAFAVQAVNGVGYGALSAAVDVLTAYDVTETFYEPDTQPRNSIFIGTFTFNSTSGQVSNLKGILSESMTGTAVAYPNDTMTWLPLNHQLSAVYDATLGGLLVTTFLNTNTNTFSTNPAFGGTNGWTPGSGFGLYYGFPGVNPGNAYAMIFVNTVDPTAPLTQAQIDKLAYADCAPGGMMGATCMTGTTVAGYGVIGTMSGYPVSLKITKRP